MSSKDGTCRKFKANIFNKSKCQNCFKPRESHLLTDEDLNQAKPTYGGWLLLAPEGTNFDNPLHRSRKWQRRFFVLYEHGLLRYALDEMPSTLPQGTINMNQCSDVVDGESRTGQKNSLGILTPDRDHFVRAECKEIINGWQEALTVYPRTNKHNLKKKRKVEPPTPQDTITPNGHCSPEELNGHTEPGPAKVAVTSVGTGGGLGGSSSSIAGAERVPATRASLWQDEPPARWSRTSTSIPCSRSASCISQLDQNQNQDRSLASTTQDDGGAVSGGRKPRVESGYFSLEKTKYEPSDPPQHLPLSSSSFPSSSSTSLLGTSNHRYTTTTTSPSDLPPPAPLSPPPLPSPGGGGSRGGSALLLSPGYSTVSSSQSSLDSEPSGSTSSTRPPTPSWDGQGGGGGGEGGGGGGGGCGGRPGREYVALSDVPRARRLNYREAFRSERKRQELRARARSPGREEVARLFGEDRRRSQVIGRFQGGSPQECMDTQVSVEMPSGPVSAPRQGRTERRYVANRPELSLDAGRVSSPDVSSTSNLPRAKSLDRRAADSCTTPDLLNFKKGWMTKLYEDGMWKKHWFVLTDQSLRYYKDSIAEEASDLDGEVDLSSCYDVTEFPVQRNYGFQILSKEGACTLSAMTSGIRRNWIQAILKSVRPAAAPPDVTRSLPEEQAKAQLAQCLQSPTEPLPVPEGPRAELHTQPAGAPVPAPAPAPVSEPRKSRVRERRREGRSKTYDWSEFRSVQATDPMDLSSALPSSSSSSTTTTSSSSYTSSAASSPGSAASSPQTSSSVSAPPPQIAAATGMDRGAEDQAPNTVTITMTTELNATPTPPLKLAPPPDQGVMEVDGQEEAVSDCDAQRQSGVEREDGEQEEDRHVEIEERWHQVETTPLREERQVPIATATTVSTDRQPPRELATLLNKELGEKQKELDRLQEQNLHLKEQLDEARGREHSAREGYVLQATCERGFSAMEETHQKLVEDLQRQHQREVSKLLEERERLLAEETAATISAIEAMKNAHKEDLEKTQRPALSGLDSDIDQLHCQYEAELQSIHRELEVLSEQYSQKCLENAHLAQALEAERTALRQCQRENQELNAHNQELNNRLTDEIMKIRSCFSGQTDLSPLTHGKDLYELEVLLRIKESEIQYLKQEIHSLKDELQSALRDKKYATDKYKGIYTELSIVKAKADCDIGKLKEKLLVATEALGERKVEGTVAPGYDIMKSKSTPDFLKKERSPLTKPPRAIRSKSLKEGLTVQERMKLFETKDPRKI